MLLTLTLNEIFSNYSDVGDFSVTGSDCDINRISLKVLYSCVIVSTFFCIALISRYLFIRSIEKKVLCYISYEAKTIFPWVFLLQLLCQLIFAIAKLKSQDDRVVGKDMFMSALCLILSFLAFLGLAIYFLVVLKFLKSYTTVLSDEQNKIINDRFVMLRTVNMLVPVVCVTINLLVLIGIKYPLYRRAFALATLITGGFLTLLYGFLTTSALRYVRLELLSHVKGFPQSSDEVRLVLRRLTLAYYMLVVMSSAMGVSYFLFCTTDSMLRKSTYLLIWLHISWPPAATILILTVSRITSRVAPEKMTSNGDPCVITDNQSQNFSLNMFLANSHSLDDCPVVATVV